MSSVPEDGLLSFQMAPPSVWPAPYAVKVRPAHFPVSPVSLEHSITRETQDLPTHLRAESVVNIARLQCRQRRCLLAPPSEYTAAQKHSWPHPSRHSAIARLRESSVVPSWPRAALRSKEQRGPSWRVRMHTSRDAKVSNGTGGRDLSKEQGYRNELSRSVMSGSDQRWPLPSEDVGECCFSLRAKVE